MVRSELIQAVAVEYNDLRGDKVIHAVDVFFEQIAERLVTGGRVELRGFGTFTTRQRAPRNGRNPQTGEAVAVPGKQTPHFKPGKEMRARLNAD